MPRKRGLVGRVGRVGVLGGHHLQRVDAVVGLDELLLHPVEEGRLRDARRARARCAERRAVAVAVPATVVDVVERDVERADAEVVHLLQLGHERLVVGVARVADGVAGGEREGEAHVVRGRRLHEVAQLGELVGGVGITPALAVIGVVLRRVDVGVRLDVAVEVDLVEPLVVRPGLAVEALDRAAQRHGRVVADRGAGDAVPPSSFGTNSWSRVLTA